MASFLFLPYYTAMLYGKWRRRKLTWTRSRGTEVVVLTQERDDGVFCQGIVGGKIHEDSRYISEMNSMPYHSLAMTEDTDGEKKRFVSLKFEFYIKNILIISMCHAIFIIYQTYLHQKIHFYLILKFKWVFVVYSFYLPTLARLVPRVQSRVRKTRPITYGNEQKWSRQNLKKKNHVLMIIFPSEEETVNE